MTDKIEGAVRLRRTWGMRGGRMAPGALVVALMLTLVGVGGGRGAAVARSLPAGRAAESGSSGLTVSMVERQLLAVLGQVTARTGALSSTAPASGTATGATGTAGVLGQLGGLSAQLGRAEGLSR